MTYRKNFLIFSGVLVLLLTLFSAQTFAAFPDKPINYLLAFDPGGESDITARLQQKALEDVLGVKVIISYKTGGGGASGWSELVRSRPDGYTIAGHNLPHIILQPLQRGNAGYQTEQLQNIYFFESTPNILAVRKDSPFKTVKDLVEYARKNPEAVTIGGSGSFTANHLGTLEFQKITGTKLTYIPFSGSGTALPALLGSNVTALMTYTTMGASYKDQVRILAVAAEKRSPALPDVPTFKELGYDYVEGAYRGVAAPPGTPPEVIKALEKAFDKVMHDPQVIKKMNEMAFDIEYIGAEESRKLVEQRTKYYKEMLEELGLLKK